jgi:hypothetical protein
MQPADPVTPLPPRFTPLARAISGARPIVLRSGPATARALATVGKSAATVDNVIHLASPAAATPPSPEVVAHELVHAARPSPIPRFFDDDHYSPEENVARSTGRLMRAITPPTEAIEATGSRALGTAGLAVGGGVGAGLVNLLGSGPSNVVRRYTTGPTSTSSSTASTTSSSSGLGGTEAALTSSGVSSTSSTEADFTGSGSPDSDPPPVPGTVGLPVVSVNGGSAGDDSSMGMLRQLLGQVDLGETQSVRFRSSMSSVLNAAPSPTPPQVGSSMTPSTNELIELIIEAIEDRVVNELERRGRRFNPGVF